MRDRIERKRPCRLKAERKRGSYKARRYRAEAQERGQDGRNALNVTEPAGRSLWPVTEQSENHAGGLFTCDAVRRRQTNVTSADPQDGKRTGAGNDWHRDPTTYGKKAGRLQEGSRAGSKMPPQLEGD